MAKKKISWVRLPYALRVREHLDRFVEIVLA
jgi:hypothetical protein